MRSMIPADIPLLLPYHQEQNERDGTEYPMPRMFDEKGRLDGNIAMALTMERDGHPTQAVYFARSMVHAVEMMFVGCDPRSTVYSAREIQAASYVLKNLKVEAIHCLIPKQLTPSLTRTLCNAGFENRFSHFFQNI